MIQRIVVKEVVRGVWKAPPTWTAHLACGHSVTRKSWEPPWQWDGFDHPELLCVECASPSPRVPMCDCEMTRGDYINRRAFTGSQLVTLRAQIPELEKLARRTPPKTLVAERAKVAAAAQALVVAKVRLVSLENDYRMWKHLEDMPSPEEALQHARATRNESEGSSG